MGDEQVCQHIQHVRGSQTTRHHERQALARVLIDDREDLHRPAILCPVADEVIRPDVMPMRGPQPEARPVRQPQPAGRCCMNDLLWVVRFGPSFSPPQESHYQG